MRNAGLLPIVLLLAGCLAHAEPAATEPASPVPDAPPRPMDWSPGNWWAYHADIQGTPIDVALIVHEATDEGFRLGSNLSIGFFGLPFHGDLTLEHNPRIGPEVWPLFAFPLEEGKEWGYTLFGYEAKSFVAPDRDAGGAYELEASSFGQTFARYDYDPQVGWFTKLDLIEPTNGTTVLSARLTAYGPDWDAAYYVEETVAEFRIDLPALPGERILDLSEGYLQMRGELSVTTRLGALTAEVRDEDGRKLAQAQAVGRGSDLARITLRPDGPAHWSFQYAGAGTGVIHLRVTGLAASGPLAAPTTAAPEVDLPGLLQSTRPDLPHAGQTTSAPAPLDANGTSVPH